MTMAQTDARDVRAGTYRCATPRGIAFVTIPDNEEAFEVARALGLLVGEKREGTEHDAI